MFGLQKLKTMCELNFPLLDKAWDRLFWSALDGLQLSIWEIRISITELNISYLNDILSIKWY